MKRIASAIHLPFVTGNPCLSYAKKECREVSYA